MKEFLASAVTKITGVKLNRLQPWMERKFITPSIEVASGHGTRNRFNRADLYKIATLKKLVEGDFHRKVAANIVSAAFMGMKTNQDQKRAESGEGGIKSVFWFVIISQQEGRTRTITDSFLHSPLDVCFGKNDKGEIIEQDPMVQLNEKIIDGFEKGGDDVFILNLSKIIDEVDSKIKEFYK
jgi:hypothetical protein